MADQSQRTPVLLIGDAPRIVGVRAPRAMAFRLGSVVVGEHLAHGVLAGAEAVRYGRGALRQRAGRPTEAAVHLRKYPAGG